MSASTALLKEALSMDATTLAIRDYSPTRLKAAALEILVSFYDGMTEESVKALARNMNSLRSIDIYFNPFKHRVDFTIRFYNDKETYQFGGPLDSAEPVDWLDPIRLAPLSALLRNHAARIVNLANGNYTRLYVGFDRVNTVVRLSGKGLKTDRYVVAYNKAA